MRFIKNGPDVPDSLIQAHSEGEVVFFCGAGISYPAGLPGFEGLVAKVYEELHENREAEEAKAFSDKRFDAVLQLLESRLDNRARIMEKIRKILTPRPDALKKPRATSTHRALLALGRDAEQVCRLVTTNFDRLFFEVGPNHKTHVAPYLPVAKRGRWDGLVYLHGLFGETPEKDSPFVVSSGDFGLAYLIDRWAARFVSDLFRNYTVCFIGYSVQDPVLRYMVDALAADSRLGEKRRAVYAFGSYEPNHIEQETASWNARGINNPILYRAGPGHTMLHDTLARWAKFYSDGLNGKCQIIIREAAGKPSTVKGDGRNERVLWALSDPRPAPSKEFAELDPPPAIGWLPILHDHGLLNRAIPLTRTFRIPLIGTSDMLEKMPVPDESFGWLAQWFARHLGKPEALHWAIERGCVLHPALAEKVQVELRKGTLPPEFAALWRAILDGRAASSAFDDLTLLRLSDEVQSEGWTSSRRHALIAQLRPTIVLRPAAGSLEDDTAEDDLPASLARRVRSLVSWDASILGGESAKDHLGSLLGRADWPETSASLLESFRDRLVEVMELMESMGSASTHSDLSHYHRPSISDHSQNAEYYPWTVLIYLFRDAWERVLATDVVRARYEFSLWKHIPYPLFRRLELHAATYPKAVDPAHAKDLLLADGGWWLWSAETQREAYRLLDSLARRRARSVFPAIWRTVLEGPPKALFNLDAEKDVLHRAIDYEQWKLIKKLQEFRAPVPTNAKRRLSTLTRKYPKWRLSPGDRDEFSIWMGSGSDFPSGPPLEPLSLDAGELAKQILNPGRGRFEDDEEWRKRCLSHPFLAMDALLINAQKRKWPINAWRVALQVFAEKTHAQLSWTRLANVVAGSPERIFRKLVRPVAWWLRVVVGDASGKLGKLESALIKRIFDVPYAALKEPLNDPVSVAINHPVGHATQALVSLWHAHKPQVGQGLPANFAAIFNRIASESRPIFRLGRCILAAEMGNLFAAAPAWTKRNLLPRFEWSKSVLEARSAWLGYLWTPRIHKELLADFKPTFLATANRYKELKTSGRTYVELLLTAGLELADTFKEGELSRALHDLPKEALPEGAQRIALSIGSAAHSKSAYWSNRAKPLIENFWPKSANRRSEAESRALAQVCIAADDAFPDAVATVRPFLMRGRSPDSTVHQMQLLAPRFPRPAIDLLDLLTADDAVHPSPRFRELLNACSAVDLGLAQYPPYRRLDEFLQGNGI